MNTHKCDPRLAHCYWHPRWKVTRADPSKRRFPWIAWAPFYGWGGAGALAFRTHAEAITYATTQAHTETTTTEEWAHRLENGGATIWPTREQAEADRENYLSRPRDPFEPRPPASAGIWRREVTHWQRVDQ